MSEPSTVQATQPRETDIKPRVQRLRQAIDGGRVLHVGCVGAPPGETHRQLAAVADAIVGIDRNRTGVDRLRADGWDARRDDAQRLSTVSDDYDYVVAGEVIEHLACPGKLFDAAGGVLADDGRLLITTPNPWAACYVRRALTASPVGNEDHTCWFDRETLAALAHRQGYRGSVEYCPPMSGGVTALAWRLGHRRFGGTRLFGEFQRGGA